jgi:hypothetical protein
MAERTEDVQAHWTRSGVLARIDAALTELGHDPQSLNPEILATLEHLHSGGLATTRRQANRVALSEDYLVLKRASASRPSGEWNDDDFDVLANGVVVGRIFKANASPVDASWMWTLAFGHHEDRTPTHGYEATREAAMAAFAKSWRRE